MPPLKQNTQKALIETLSFLELEHRVRYSSEEGQAMLNLFLGLPTTHPNKEESFLTLNLYMRGQMLLICSQPNKYYFQLTHPDTPLTLENLALHWAQSLAAERYRNKSLVPTQ